MTDSNREITPVDNEPSEVDIAVDAALAALFGSAYNTGGRRPRLQMWEDHINTCGSETPHRRRLLTHSSEPPN